MSIIYKEIIMKLRNLLLFVILFYSGITFSQTIGKIYTKAYADSAYGKVVESVAINVSDLNSVISQAQNVVMFSIMNKQLVLLGDNRKVLTSTPVNISATDVFTVCSKSVMLQLLKYGDGNQVYFETRIKVRTITYGMHTMELLGFCPPLCH